ncbi:DUF1996 domain-containing protein [Actinomycetospora aeridis]|uniref:DUF1996 domain-containing protein n=1 Tax=Actinomycetospora aeridis TaxID=3129231 RepID=A0ABU8N2X5_9PSEU
MAALLLTGGAVTVAGSAFADSDSDSGSDSGLLSSLVSGDDSDSSGSEDEASSDEDGSGDGQTEGEENGEDTGDGENAQAEDENADEGQGGDENADQGQNGEDGQEDGGDGGAQAQAAEDEDPLKRDQIAPASADEYVDITDVDVNRNRGEGGVFADGSYTINCGTSDHNNPSNFMVAPGNPNGAQHTHDYVGNTTTDENSDEASLEAGGTSCTNGDKSTFFWPVLRDLNGTDSDANADGGGNDGNVGRILTPRSADITFHRTNADQEVAPLPQHLEVIMGNAKAAAQDGKNANAKYTCSGFTDRITDQYPICPSGSRLMRVLDYPNCWDGENLSSEDLRSHIRFPDENGRCADGETNLPALRITLTYDQPAGRAFSIDSFPDNQHDPTTDHSDFMHFSSVARAQEGADCLNGGRQCTQN